jgi:hypothetical protein
MGGADNLELAKKYYSYALELSQDNNVRALYGLLLVRERHVSKYIYDIC